MNLPSFGVTRAFHELLAGSPREGVYLNVRIDQAPQMDEKHRVVLHLIYLEPALAGGWDEALEGTAALFPSQIEELLPELDSGKYAQTVYRVVGRAKPGSKRAYNLVHISARYPIPQLESYPDPTAGAGAQPSASGAGTSSPPSGPGTPSDGGALA